MGFKVHFLLEHTWKSISHKKFGRTSPLILRQINGAVLANFLYEMDFQVCSYKKWTLAADDQYYIHYCASRERGSNNARSTFFKWWRWTFGLQVSGIKKVFQLPSRDILFEETHDIFPFCGWKQIIHILDGITFHSPMQLKQSLRFSTP